jgi:hypothetical protein
MARIRADAQAENPTGDAMIVSAGKAAASTITAWLCMAYAATAAHALELAPHRALYDLNLAAARAGSDIVGLSGRMMLEWADACEGWTVNQKVQMSFTNREGPPLDNEFSFSSFETKDGDSFRFSMRSTANGEPFEEYVGSARRDASGGAVRFTVPTGEELDLPQGITFPTEHLFLLVEAALAGDKWIGATVFSGTGLDSLHEVTAFIGTEIAEGDAAAQPDDAVLALVDLRSWPVSMAYFPLATQEPEPEFEVSYRLLENGVAGNLVLDYGDFAMRAVLSKLEFLSPPDC